jgi:hypothetical protein
VSPRAYEVVRERFPFRGTLVNVRVDTVRMPDGSEAEREVVTHPDSVAVVAVDDNGRVLLIHQYRHPLRAELWELPAGLRDENGESAEQTARREPDREGEEADLVPRWVPLEEACAEVFDGGITNGHTVAGLLGLAVRQG